MSNINESIVKIDEKSSEISKHIEDKNFDAAISSIKEMTNLYKDWNNNLLDAMKGGVK